MRRLNALVIEDDVGLGQALQEFLAGLGHSPWLADSAGAARDVLGRTPIDFSLVDLHVRTDSGLLIVSELRARLGRLPVIFMSGAFTPELVARARELGAYGTLAKPLDLSDLRRALEKLITAEQF